MRVPGDDTHLFRQRFDRGSARAKIRCFASDSAGVFSAATAPEENHHSALPNGRISDHYCSLRENLRGRKDIDLMVEAAARRRYQDSWL